MRPKFVNHILRRSPQYVAIDHAAIPIKVVGPFNTQAAAEMWVAEQAPADWSPVGWSVVELTKP